MSERLPSGDVLAYALPAATIGFLPAILNLLAVIIFQRFPITRELHDEMRSELERRALPRPPANSSR